MKKLWLQVGLFLGGIVAFGTLILLSKRMYEEARDKAKVELDRFITPIAPSFADPKELEVAFAKRVDEMQAELEKAKVDEILARFTKQFGG